MIFHECEHETQSLEFTGRETSEKEQHKIMGFGSDDPDKPINIFKKQLNELINYLTNKMVCEKTSLKN